MAQFGSGRLEKLPARRGIEKNLFDLDAGSHRRPDDEHGLFASFDSYPVTDVRKRRQEVISILETDAILGSASPLNPKVATRKRSASSKFAGCMSLHRKGEIFRPIPSPLSVTRISIVPLFSIETEISVSAGIQGVLSSSLTTDAGRSTTSPRRCGWPFHPREYEFSHRKTLL